MLLLLLAAMLFVGCQKDIEVLPLQEQKGVTIELSLSQIEATRNTPTAMESTINSLRIYAFYNNKMVGYLYREATEAGTPFYMDLQLPESGTHNVEFYVVANEAEMASENGVVVMSESMSKVELEAITFTGLNKGNALPMYEKSVEAINVDAISGGANSVAGHEGHPLLSQTIEFTLSRPIAKMSVYAAKVSGTASNPLIHKIDFLAAGTRQYNYLFPQEEALLNEIPSRANNRELLSATATITKAINKGSAEAQDPTNYTEVIEGIYLSEVAVGSTSWSLPSSDNGGVLRVEYAGGEGQVVKTQFVYLPPIKRNHHIKVCILINAEGEVVINYEVAEWEKNEMQNYHFDYPTHSYIMASLPTTENPVVEKPSTMATMAEGVPFRGYFQMSKPTNDAWTPTLLGLNGSNCEIIIYEVESGNEVTTLPIPASEKWYRIEVWPLGGKMSDGEETKLAVSYTASGFIESEFLLINGSNIEHYWPYSGSTAQNAEYVIITMVK